ncbi:hypothetical protein [Caldimonas tepidiphila]|uniref:DUF7834 domain-containing protein n=1 Tax=Caldimonas tepidiphila TaxID=2315841 RepID=UPI000E5A8DCC|nr:hypothetical protein [Caldimonas tepidiphila]
MYADRFGCERLPEFGLRLEHVLGSIRIEQRYVMRETARNFFRDGRPNLLDVIAAAFTPDEVMEHLAAVTGVEERYARRDREVGVGRDVRGRYKAAVLRYYGQPDTAGLQHKHQWMNERIEASNV